MEGSCLCGEKGEMREILDGLLYVRRATMFHFFYVNFFYIASYHANVTNSDAEFVTRQTKFIASSDAFSFVQTFRLSKNCIFPFQSETPLQI